MSKEIYIATTERLGVLMLSTKVALPTLYAAVFEYVKKGGLYGPDGEDGLSGYPAYTATSVLAYDIVLAKKVWEKAEEITGQNVR